MCKLISIFEVDFLNNVFLFKFQSILEVYSILKKSWGKSGIIKYKQSTFLFASAFILNLYFFLGSSLKHTSTGLEGSEV